MSLVLFDHQCQKCQHVFEDLVRRDSPMQLSCPKCGGLADRQIGAVRFDPRMGLDPDFPTAADKWARRRLQHQQIEERRNREHGD